MNTPCPACGFCPCCGRANPPAAKPWPTYPQPYIGDPLPWQQPYVGDPIGGGWFPNTTTWISTYSNE